VSLAPIGLVCIIDHTQEYIHFMFKKFLFWHTIGVYRFSKTPPGKLTLVMIKINHKLALLNQECRKFPVEKREGVRRSAKLPVYSF